MIDSIRLRSLIADYLRECELCNKIPLKSDVSELLGINARTLYNVRMGSYNGNAYGKKESYNRCISNCDFPVIRGIW